MTLTCATLSFVTPNPSHHQRLFGPFAFEDETEQLWKHGVRLRLQGQPLDVLVALLERPGQVVTREELQRRLWPQSTFGDFDHGLNVATNRLRQALGDSADQPRYIETLPGKGYRFLAPVQDAGPVPEAMAKPLLVMTPRSDPAASRRRSAMVSGMIAAGVLAAVAFGYLLGSRSPAPLVPPPLRWAIAPPTGYFFTPASSRQSFAFSPDGTRLAFSAMASSGVFRTFVRDRYAAESRPLPNTEGTFSLFWAPDGRSVFTTSRGKLRRNAMDRDAYQELCDLPAMTITGMVLGPEITIAARSGNFRVPVIGGTPRRTEETYPWPQLLPDGRHLLYTVFDPKAGHHRARIVETGRPETARDLLETDSKTLYSPSVLKPGTGYLFAVRAGILLAFPFNPESGKVLREPKAVAPRVYSFLPTGAADFSVAADGMLAYLSYLGRSQLTWMNRRGEAVSAVGPSNIAVGPGRLSPDGRKIATVIFDVERGVNDAWIFEAHTGASQRFAERGTVNGTVWSPDSNHFAFGLAYDFPPKLFVRGLGVRDSNEALPPAYFQDPTDWSKSGRYLAWSNSSFAQMANEMKGEFWVTEMAGKRKAFRLSNSAYHESYPVFSPDGKWLAFVSNQSGSAEVYIQAFEADPEPHLSGERHLISRNGAIAIRWRGDGKELFYLGFDSRIYGVPVILSPKPLASSPVPLFAISPEARAAMHAPVGFDVSKDGQRFLISTVTSSDKSAITVLQNWELATGENNRRE